MIAYNLYSKGQKINARPLTKDTIDKIITEGKFSKRVSSNIYKQYDMNNVKIIKCILV